MPESAKTNLCQLKLSVTGSEPPLSELNTIIVLSLIPNESIMSHILPTLLSNVSTIAAYTGFLWYFPTGLYFLRSRYRRMDCMVGHIQEKWFLSISRLSDKLDSLICKSVCKILAGSTFLQSYMALVLTVTVRIIVRVWRSSPTSGYIHIKSSGQWSCSIRIIPQMPFTYMSASVSVPLKQLSKGSYIPT